MEILHVLIKKNVTMYYDERTRELNLQIALNLAGNSQEFDKPRNSWRIQFKLKEGA